MKVEVLYRSHRYEEFDTSLTCPEPHRKEGVSILTDWNLYLGDLKGQGVILVQHWYDGTPPQQGENRGSFRFDDGTMVTAAVRRPGSAMLLVAPDELDGIVWLKKDGEKILWREGDDLINGERFFAMEQLCYSDAATVSINKRALAVFDYLKHVHPGRQRRDRCRQHGLHARRDPAHTGRGAGAGRRLRRRGTGRG